MNEQNKGLIVMLTSGKEDRGKRATLAFSAACSALAMGGETQVFLVGDGAHWGYEGHTSNIKHAGFPSLRELMSEFVELGGQIYVCSTCDKVCAVPGELDQPVLKRRPEVSPRGFTAVLSDVMGGGSSVTF